MESHNFLFVITHGTSLSAVVILSTESVESSTLSIMIRGASANAWHEDSKTIGP